MRSCTCPAGVCGFSSFKSFSAVLTASCSDSCFSVEFLNTNKWNASFVQYSIYRIKDTNGMHLEWRIRTHPMSASRFSNTSPPIVSLSGLRQISIMLYTAFWPQSLSFLALLKWRNPSLGSPVYLWEADQHTCPYCIQFSNQKPRPVIHLSYLHLHIVILLTLLSKVTYKGIHKAIHLKEANRQRKCS